MNDRTGLVVADRLLPAFDSVARRRGLLGVDTFPAGSAMVIGPSNAIHTFFMKFAIDVLFVAKDGRVVKVREGVRPWRIAGAWRAYCVIELAAGGLEGSDTQVGDVVSMRPIDST